MVASTNGHIVFRSHLLRKSCLLFLLLLLLVAMVTTNTWGSEYGCGSKEPTIPIPPAPVRVTPPPPPAPVRSKPAFTPAHPGRFGAKKEPAAASPPAPLSTKGEKGGGKGKGFKNGAGEGKGKFEKITNKKVHLHFSEMSPAMLQQVLKEKIKNLNGRMKRNLRDHPELASKIKKAASPSRSRSRAKRPRSTARSRSRNKRTKEASYSSSSSDGDAKEEENVKAKRAQVDTTSQQGAIIANAKPADLKSVEEKIALAASVPPWAYPAVPMSSTLGDMQHVNIQVFGYAATLITWAQQKVVDREKLVSISASILNMATTSMSPSNQ